MHYRVLDEQPIRAKRSARGLGAYYASADVRDYPTTLTVALKPLGAGAILVTLDYGVTHTGGISSKGDRQTLRREAEAILALAADRVGPTSCRKCGAYNPGDSRYCRLCGAHCAASEPAELEVLRLTAGAQAGHQLNVVGIVFGLLTLLLSMLLAASGKASAAKMAFTILMLGEAIALVVMMCGASYLHGALNQRKRGEQLPAGARRSFPPNVYEPLPPPAPRGSVTEGTTGLLGAQPEQHEPPELRRERLPIDRIK
jgi:ribosomal protein L40E